jgi:hypothetical protein
MKILKKLKYFLLEQSIAECKLVPVFIQACTYIACMSLLTLTFTTVLCLICGISGGWFVAVPATIFVGAFGAITHYVANKD